MLWIIVIGFLIGVVAKFIMPGNDPGGIIMTILLGIAGSWVANWLGINMGWHCSGEAAGFISSVLGAMLLLFLYRVLVAQKKT